MKLEKTLFGPTQLLHTMVGMGSTAVADFVVLLALGDPHFCMGLMTYSKRNEMKQA